MIPKPIPFPQRQQFYYIIHVIMDLNFFNTFMHGLLLLLYAWKAFGRTESVPSWRKKSLCICDLVGPYDFTAARNSGMK